ncbi:hypothetical protein HDV57DRAFT_133478 [Trichoderma longibrachiatum]|uniref:Uncharacterized protein n=1 Tax=Trichoderma longibrachiatum ATCC 18648 TaxID=983965 RepID=A0A2T4BRU3_TRILO|nr:hypothetical protein M440DRAFT_1097798 [Trichoderma longibrachiatum ATCC 18648]
MTRISPPTISHYLLPLVLLFSRILYSSGVTVVVLSPLHTGPDIDEQEKPHADMERAQLQPGISPALRSTGYQPKSGKRFRGPWIM